MNRFVLFTIVVLSFIIGYLWYMLRRKIRNDVIKIEIRKDLLPPPGGTTRWIQGGPCFMADGSVGEVDGRYCKQLIVI